MDDREISVLVGHIERLQKEIDILKSRMEPRIFGMTDRMTERIAWLIVVVLIMIAMDNTVELSIFIRAIAEMIMGE